MIAKRGTNGNNEKNAPVFVNIIYRYIFRSVLGSASLAVGLFVFVLVVGNAIREVIDQLGSGRIDLGTFAYLILLLIPGVVPYALPLGLLAAILLVLGRLSAQTEITAMKACGFSLLHIAAPVFMIAFLGSVFSVFINFYYAPAADTAYRTTLHNLVRDNPLQFLQPNVFIRDFPGYVIYVGGRDGERLRDFWVWEMDDKGRTSLFLKAHSGTFAYDEASDAIRLTLTEGVAEKYPEAGKTQVYPTLAFKETTVSLSLARILGSATGTKKWSIMTVRELLTARKNPEALGFKGTPEELERVKFRAQMQIQKNLAFAFSILSMAALAVPFGIKASRSETFANFGIALALAMTYYLLTVMIGWLEKYPNMRPDLLIWTPNICFQLIGAWLLMRANKH